MRRKPAPSDPPKSTTANFRSLPASYELTAQVPVIKVPAAKEVDAEHQGPRALRILRQGEPTVTCALYADRAYRFGRDPESAFVFSSTAVSRHHGVLATDAGGDWVFRDLGSTNGTFLTRGPKAETVDPREGARRLATGKDRRVDVGDTLLLGNGESRLSFVREVPLDALGATHDPGGSPAAKSLAKAIATAGRHSLPVFLLGASGSGKTRTGRLIHEASGRPGQFILVNCGRLPADPTQLQSELLGHEKGAFTGAEQTRVGKLFAAAGGTLFLDEVESMPEAAQRFMLDVLEGTGNFAPLGAQGGHHVRAPAFRLISASKRPLGESGLRGDLQQRLAGDIIALPGLAERNSDVPALVDGFLAELEATHRIRARLTSEAMARLQKHRWPGEIRELERTVQTVVHRAWAEAEPPPPELVIGAAVVDAYLAQRAVGFGASAPALAPGPSTARKRPGDLSAADLAAALQAHGGNKTRAAQALGIAVNTLKAKLKELGFTPG